MDKKKAAFIALLACVLAGQALARGSATKFNSNADDVMKISSLLEEFRQDIIHKDGDALTKLVLNPDVLFHSINNKGELAPSALDGFARLLATSKDKLEEKFRNIEIHQDGSLGLATFNYDFLVNDKVTHSGVEHWIVCKVDGQWKIVAVVWTKYEAKND